MLMQLLRTIMVLVTIGALVVGSGSVLVAHAVGRPRDAQDQHVYVIEVVPGATVTEVATTLQRYGLITHPRVFRWIAQAQQVKDVAPGTYPLRKSMTMNEIVTLVRVGPADVVPTAAVPPAENP
jgi:UPF0755 protein